MNNRMFFLRLAFLGISILYLGKGKNGVKKAYTGIFMLIGVLITALGAYGIFTSFLH